MHGSTRGIGLPFAIVALAAQAVACGPMDAPPSATHPVPSESVGMPDATPSMDPHTTIYVSPEGDDDNPGTKEEPIRTVEHGMLALEPGHTLVVGEGRYVENIQNPPIETGAPDRPITVVAAPGEHPVIEGFVWLTDADHWIIDGINVTWRDGNPVEHMVKMTNGAGWVWRNSELQGARSFANLLVVGTVPNEPSDWRVEGNCIHDTLADPPRDVNTDHNLYVNTGLSAGTGVIERNIFFGAPNGENIKLGGAESTAEEGAANVIIRFNTLHSAEQNLLLAGGTHDVLIEGNLIGTVGNPGGYAIRAYRLTGQNNRVQYNYFYDVAQLVEADSEFGTLTLGAGNVRVSEVPYDEISCDGFRPIDPEASAYGRYAR